VGGNKIEYAGDTSTPTANLTTAKLVVNSVVSTPDAKFATGDISDFYLFTNMDKCKYMWIPIQFLNPEVIAAYELKDLIVDGRVLAEISKDMYGLPQAGRLAYNQLVLNLGCNGYHPCKKTHGLWCQVTRPILFHWWSTISESNTSANSTRSIYLPRCAKITKSPKIGPENSTWTSH